MIQLHQNTLENMNAKLSEPNRIYGIQEGSLRKYPDWQSHRFDYAAILCIANTHFPSIKHGIHTIEIATPPPLSILPLIQIRTLLILHFKKLSFCSRSSAGHNRSKRLCFRLGLHFGHHLAARDSQADQGADLAAPGVFAEQLQYV